MVEAHKEVRQNPVALANGLLSLLRIDHADRLQAGAAMTLAEFVIKVNRTL